MDILRQDLRAALAAIRRSPGVAVTATLTLALGIGGMVAVFATLHGVLLRPLPYAAPGQLVRLWEERPGGSSPAGNRWLSRGTYVRWSQQARTLDALGGYGVAEFQVAWPGDRVTMIGARVSSRVLATLGVAPATGRLLTENEDRQGASPAVVLSHALWRERFGAAPEVLGRTLAIDGAAHTIVGVMPPAFAFPEPGVRFWVPYAIPRAAVGPGPIVVTALGRLKPGATLAQAEAEGTAAARAAPADQVTDFFFGTGAAPVVHARRLSEDLTLEARPPLSMLAVAVALVLAIACLNVAGLRLTQGATREGEFAIRAAVGGSRGRLARQLFTEGALIAAAGSAAGLLVGAWLVQLARRFAPPMMPRLAEVTIDGAVLALWGLATGAALLAAAVVPALAGARGDLLRGLPGTTRTAETGYTGVRSRRLRDVVLAIEAALAIVLIVGASLLSRSLLRLLAVDSGYTASGVLVASLEMPDGAPAARMDLFIEQAVERAGVLPGVERVAAGAMVPLMKRTAMAAFTVPAASTGGKPTQGRARLYTVTPRYAEALGLRLAEGRFLEPADRDRGTVAVVVNQEFVRRHLAVPRVSGLLVPGLVESTSEAPAEIVGVVGDVLKGGNHERPEPEIYLAQRAHGHRIAGRVNLVIRTTADPASLAPAVRALVREVDPGIVIDRIEPLATDVAASLDRPRFAAAVMGAFAAVATLLAAIGLFGALAYSVSQRDRELGVRSALGATRRDLLRLVVSEGLLVLLPGIALGLIGAIAFTRTMQTLLFGVTPLDVVAFAVAPLLLLGTAVLASLIPALRATRADPAVALRR